MKATFLIFIIACLELSLPAQQLITESTTAFYSTVRTDHTVMAGGKLLRLESSLHRNLEKCKTEIQVLNAENLRVSLIRTVGNSKDDVPIISQLTRIGGRVFVLYEAASGKDFWNKRGDMRMAEIDTINFTLLPAHTIAQVEKNDFSTDVSNTLHRMHMGIIKSSPDKKKFVHFFNLPGRKEYLISVFDASMNILYERKEVPGDKGNLNFFDVCVHDSGKAYAAYGVYPGKNSGVPDKLAAISTFSTEGIITRYINAGDARPDVIRLLASVSGQVYFTGFYNEDRSSVHSGVFYGVIHPAGDLTITQKKEIPLQLVEQFRKDGWANAQGLHLEIFPHPVELVDGTIALVGEFIRDVPVTGTLALYNFKVRGSILAVFFKNREIYYTRIGRDMRNDNAYAIAGESFFLLPDRNKLRILYNDNEKNFKQDPQEKPVVTIPYSNTILVTATVESNGNSSKQVLTDHNNAGYLALVENANVVSSEIIWVPLVKVRSKGSIEAEKRWLKITLQ